MMSEFNVNINDKIKVKLTAKGQEILDEVMRQNLEKFHLTEDFNPYKNYPDAEGYTEFRLWNFMNIFGSYFMNGGPCCVEDNKIICINDEGQNSNKDQFSKVDFYFYAKLEDLRQTIISMDLSYSQTCELLAQILRIEDQLTDMETKSNPQF